MKFYYNHLESETEKTVYRDLKNAVENHERLLHIPVDISGHRF